MDYAVVDATEILGASGDAGFLFRVFPGGAMILTSDLCPQEPTEYRFQNDPNGIHISAQFFLSGDASILMGNGGTGFWSENSLSIIRSDTPGFRLRVDAGQTLRHVCVAMYHHDLNDLRVIDDNEQMMMLMAVGASVDMAVPVPASKGMRDKAEVLHALGGERGLSGLKAEALSMEFLASALEAYSTLSDGVEAPGNPAPWQRDAARRIRQAIDADPLAPMDVDTLLGRFGLGAAMAGRVFRAEVGMTLNGYLRSARLDWAREALRRGDSVKSVAFACGYAHIGNFTRAYKQAFGESPTVTRQRAWGA